MFIILKNNDGIIRAVEGTGDALTLEDLEKGYVDYIYYDEFDTLEDVYEQNSRDGGIILLQKPYKDYSRDEIADMVGEEVRRGVTMIKGTGWYSKKESEIVMVVVRKIESQRVIRIVKQIDPAAFVSVNSVMGVYGKGFEMMKK